MSQFDVTITHALSEADARERLKGVQAKLESDYGVSCRWTPAGDMLVQRKGLDGTVRVLPGQLQVNVKLGFLLSALGNKIREGIVAKLTRLMDGQETA